MSPMKYPKYWVTDCADLVEAFNNNGVEYLLVGSMAKSHYHSQSHVNDMDLLINPTPENAHRVDFVLRNSLGWVVHHPNRLSERDKQFYLFSYFGEPAPAHVITPTQDFSFCKAFSRSTEGCIPGLAIRVRIASVRDLEALDALRRQSGQAEGTGG